MRIRPEAGSSFPWQRIVFGLRVDGESAAHTLAVDKFAGLNVGRVGCAVTGAKVPATGGRDSCQ